MREKNCILNQYLILICCFQLQILKSLCYNLVDYFFAGAQSLFGHIEHWSPFV